MSNFKPPTTFKGKYVGVFVLAIIQFVNGIIHTSFGLALLYAMSGELIYNIYTLLYGSFTLIFAYGLWTGKKSGWLGTILISLLVIVVDIFTVLDIRLIAGVPKSAAASEIFTSIIFLVYLFQPKIVRLFKGQ